MDYSAYNQQQQQQQQQQYSYEYDPSQIQAYDQSYAYQSYYAYNPQYAAAYYPDPNQAQFQYQPESVPVHPPGVNPTAPEPAPLRPAHAPTGQSSYRGRGGRGGRGNRGGGRGQFSRGRGRGRHFPSHSSGPTISNAISVPAASETTLVVQPSSSTSAQVAIPKQAQAPAAPVHPPPPKAWCEICNVGCNTFEVMEQHKNGKKHLKNVKAHEQLQRQKALNGQQNEQIPTTQVNVAEQPKNVEESEKNGCPTENKGSEVTAVNHKDETVPQNTTAETSAGAAEESEGNTRDNPTVRGRGLKRKARGGKASKLARSADGSRRPVEPLKAEQFVPFKCDLCNVKCESEVVYQSHVAGKKHLSNLKRVHGPQAALTGLLGLQSFYPPADINALSNAINAQVQQGDNDPQVLLAQLLMNVLSQAQGPSAAPLAGPVAAQMPAALTSVAGTSYDPQLLQTQVSAFPTNVDAPAFPNISSQVASGSFEPQQQVLQHPQDGSVMALADNSGAAAAAASDQMPSTCEAPTS